MSMNGCKWILAVILPLFMTSIHAQNFAKRYELDYLSNEFHNIYFHDDTITTIGFGVPPSWPFRAFNSISTFDLDGTSLQSQVYIGDSVIQNFPLYQHASQIINNRLYTTGTGGEFALNEKAFIFSFNGITKQALQGYTFASKPGFNIQIFKSLTSINSTLYGIMIDRNLSNLTRATLVKFDEDLNLLDEILISDIKWDFDPNVIISDSDSTLIIGLQYRIKANETPTENFHSVVLRIDTLGNVLDEFIGPPYSGGVNNMIFEDEHFYFVDRQFKEVVNTEAHFRSKITKLNFALEELWSMEFGNQSPATDLYDLIQLSSGDFIASGQNIYDAHLIKFGPDGEIFWERNFDIPSSSPIIDSYTVNPIYDILELPNEDLLLCGASIDYFADSIPQQGLLIRTNSEGLITQIIEGPPIINQQNIKIFPNPTSQFINLDTDEEISSCETFDISGNLVLTSSAKHSINVEHLAPGTYFVVVNKRYGGKFVKM